MNEIKTHYGMKLPVKNLDNLHEKYNEKLLLKFNKICSQKNLAFFIPRGL